MRWRAHLRPGLFSPNGTRRQDDSAPGFHVEPGETAVVIEDVDHDGRQFAEVCDILRAGAQMRSRPARLSTGATARRI